MIREIKPKVPFEVTCDECKTSVRVMAHNADTALPTTWLTFVEHTEGNHGRGYHSYTSHICPVCKGHPKYATAQALSK